MGVQNSDSHQKLVAKLGCWPGRFVARLIVFTNGDLKVSFRASGGHTRCHSELRILSSLRRVTPKFWFASKIGSQTRVLTWSFGCTILVAFANVGLKVSLNILRWLQNCYSERRILIGRRHTKILIRIKIQWSNSGVDLVVLLYDSHSCANGCLELIVQGTRRHTCHSELRILYWHSCIIYPSIHPFMHPVSKRHGVNMH